ncbi:MAG: beta strand repeat-containing protein, partial [Candidatus Eiseniibacteriota bacterium]
MLFMLAIGATSAQAQVNVTASGGVANASYAELRLAFAAINSGTHTGTIAIDISGNTAETASAVLNASGGTSSYASISISPSGGATRTISGAIAGALIDLNGADNVTIDGLNSGGNALTIANTSTAATAMTLRFINDATSNMIRNVTLNGSSTGAALGTIYFGTTTGGTTGNDNNTVTGCNIGPSSASLPVNAIYALGTTTTAALNNSGVAITNNNIYDYFLATGGSSGMTVSSGNSDWTISGNSIYQTAARAYTAGTATSYGVFISTLAGAGNNFLVSGNFVGGRAANAGGAAWTVTGNFAESFVGIGTAVNSGSIQNNTIANFAWSGNGNWRGIQTTRGTVNIGTVTGNTIGAGTGTGSVTLTGALAAGTTAIGIDASSSTAGLLVAVSNNVIGAITTSGTGATIPVNITGILAGANVVSISNNTVGSTTTANSISANNGAGTASTGQFVTGISSSSAVALAITGNSVANLNDAYTGSVAGGQIRGILTTAGPNTISGNTVRNLSTASAATGVNASAAVIGIAQTSLTASNNVSQNVVHSLSSTAASAAANVIGIHYAGPTTGSNLVARNLIHSLSLATTSTAAGIIGINASGGIATYQNNMVRLGIDAAGNSLVRSYAITGIAKSTVSTPNAFYFNSVYVGGTGVAPTATNTYAFLRVATGVDDIRDNIFVNARQNAAGGGRHFAFALNAVTTVTSDYNVYSVAPGSADLASVDGGVTSLGTIQALRLTPSYGQDINSGAGDPRFVAPADPAASVSLKLQNPTPAEGTGISIGSVTDDQEGEARSTLSPADIGADAGLYSLDASTDIFTPRISYTPLVSTSLTGDRTVTATITDVGPAGGGLPSAGPNLPRIWYKKSTDGSWTLSNPGSLVSGDGRNGTWSFTIAAAGLSPTLGDVIQYYVVAQDQATAPNLWYNPVAATDPIHSDVTTQTTPPSAPNSYTIAEFAGTFYVPNDPGGQPTRTYPSLTKAGGFFAAVNSTPVSGNITVIVNGDVTNEDGTNKLNQWVEEGAGSYTLTIQPDAATLRTLSGAIIAANTPMLDMNGADRVTIDGSFSGGGQYLMLRNSGTASTVQPTIQFNNTATNDAVRNCIVENNTSNAARGDVVIGAVGANANIQITGNELRGSTGGTIGNPTNLIVGNNAGNSAITISNNNLHNFNFSAVNFGGWSNSSNLVGSNITISGNSAYGTASPSTNLGVCVFGIGGAGDGHLVSGNFIGGQAPQCGGAAWPWATGGGSNYSWGISIRASGTVTGSSVQGNTIQNMAFSGNIYGFYAINTENGKFAIGTVNGNTIGHPTTANSITFARGAVQAPIVIGINAGFGGVNSSLDVRNNVIANLVGVNSGSVDPYFRAISLSPGFPGTTGNCTVENNSITNLSFPGNGGSGNNSAGIIMATLGSPAPAVAYDIGGIAGNTLSGLTFGTGSAANYAIYIASGATTGQVVSNNNITGITGVMPFYGIGINTPYNAAVSSIQNNIVQGVTLSGASAEFRGISLTGTVVSPNGFGPASATGNLVGSDTAPNSISNSGGAATTGFWIEGYNSPSAGLIDLSNSIVANLTASGTGSAVAVRGIYSGPSGGNVGMSGVNIHDLSTAATNASDGASAPAVAGIWLMGAANPYVQNSTIHGLHATTTGSFAVAVDGIYANGGSGTVERNRVWDLTNSAGSATASVRGVYQYGGTWAMANNEISVTNGANTNPLQLFGIAQNLASGSGVGNVSYNSVYLGGSVSSGVANSYGFARQANFADVLADNLFFNDRTNSGGAGSHYAVSASATGSWSSDHNAFIATDAATLGQWSGADQAFAPWQAASGGDAASLGETAANVPAVQLLSDAANGILDIKPTSGYDVPPIVSNGGAPVIGITTDFGGLNIRDASHPDIGANEITVSRAL